MTRHVASRLALSLYSRIARRAYVFGSSASDNYLRFSAAVFRPAFRGGSSAAGSPGRELAIFVKVRHTVFLISQPQRRPPPSNVAITCFVINEALVHRNPRGAHLPSRTIAVEQRDLLSVSQYDEIRVVRSEGDLPCPLVLPATQARWCPQCVCCLDCPPGWSTIKGPSCSFSSREKSQCTAGLPTAGRWLCSLRHLARR